MLIEFDERFKWLTHKQKGLANIARKSGFVRLREFKAMYSSKEHWLRAITKLLDFGIITPDPTSPAKFRYLAPTEKPPQLTLFDIKAAEKEEQKELEVEQ